MAISPFLPTHTPIQAQGPTPLRKLRGLRPSIPLLLFATLQGSTTNAALEGVVKITLSGNEVTAWERVRERSERGCGSCLCSLLALYQRFAGFNTGYSSSTMTQPTDEFKIPDPSQAQDDRPTPFDSPSLRLVPRLEGVVVTLCRVQHRNPADGII